MHLLEILSLEIKEMNKCHPGSDLADHTVMMVFMTLITRVTLITRDTNHTCDTHDTRDTRISPVSASGGSVPGVSVSGRAHQASAG